MGYVIRTINFKLTGMRGEKNSGDTNCPTETEGNHVKSPDRVVVSEKQNLDSHAGSSATMTCFFLTRSVLCLSGVFLQSLLQCILLISYLPVEADVY
jgi:hypothetical protein